MAASSGDQINKAGHDVSLQLWADAPDGAELVYTVSGLPGDLNYNEETGEIYGVVSPNAVSDTPYEVTADVTNITDGQEAEPVTFLWTVHALPV